MNILEYPLHSKQDGITLGIFMKSLQDREVKQVRGEKSAVTIECVLYDMDREPESLDRVIFNVSLLKACYGEKQNILGISAEERKTPEARTEI